MAIIISDNVDFKSNTVTRHKEVHYEDKRVTSPRRYSNYKYCAPNLRAPKYLKLTLTELKEETDSKTITAGVFNTPTFSHE